MRKRQQGQALSVHAIAGTYVVLLGMDLKQDASQGLLGFTISRETAGVKGRKYLGGGKYFASVTTNHDSAPSAKVPIQSFLWGDYEAQPGQTYTYRVRAQYGTPGQLKAAEEVVVTIETEKREDGVHSIYFNRGIAGSQAYSRRFGDYRRWYLVDDHGTVVPRNLLKPADVPNRDAYQWLSRGLEEAMLDFIAQATGPGYSIRAAVYEFTYRPAIQAFVDAIERGVDVKIVHHAKHTSVYELLNQKDPKDGSTDWKVNTTTTWDSGNPPPTTLKNKYLKQQRVKDAICQAADAAVARVGLKNDTNLPAFSQMLIERTNTTISHNKFIVLLKDDKPVQVWTGSTNFTEGGIFGQSNVGHVVRDEQIAAQYLAYWNELSGDPVKSAMTGWTAANSPELNALPPKNSITPIFSPRPTKEMLKWYAERIGQAVNSVFFTAAFSVDDSFMKQLIREKPVAPGEAYQRYVILESRTELMRDKYKSLLPVKQNRMAWGDTLKSRQQQADEQLIESLTGLNENVQYLHTKYLLIDPLSDDPLVMTGSANFSEASTIANDENLLIIRGDTRVADIFIGEFMRLFNHFAARNQQNILSDELYAKSQQLAEDDSWVKPYYKEGTQKQQERLLFR